MESRRAIPRAGKSTDADSDGYVDGYKNADTNACTLLYANLFAYPYLHA